MRYFKYLTEAANSIKDLEKNSRSFSEFNHSDRDEFVKMWSKISSDCKPYLSILAKVPVESFLFRGMNKNDEFLEITPRRDRVALNTNKGVHVILDNALEDIFGWKPRSEGVFTSTLSGVAGSFGNTVYIVFPVGKFKYLWSDDIRDSFVKFDTSSIMRYYYEFNDLTYSYASNSYKKTPIYEPGDSWFSVEDKVLSALEKGDKRLDSFRDYIADRLVGKEFDYKDTDLNKAFSKNTEVIIHCEKYYCISTGYRDWIEYLVRK